MQNYSAITHTQVSWDSCSMKEVPLRVPWCSATPDMPLRLEIDLSIILVTAADTSQWNTQDLQKEVFKLQSMKDTKIPLRRRMTTAKPLFSYFHYLSSKQNRSQSLSIGSRRTGEKFKDHHFFYTHFFLVLPRVLLSIYFLSCSQWKEKCSKCCFIQKRQT